MKKIFFCAMIIIFTYFGFKVYDINRQDKILSKQADDIYNLIVSDEYIICDQEVREMSDEIDFCYETEKFFKDQPVEYYQETKQCAFSNDGGNFFGLAVIKLLPIENSYTASNEAFDNWINNWTLYKKRMFNSAYQHGSNEAKEMLLTYEKNSAIVRTEDTIVILYSNSGIETLKRNFKKVNPLFN